MRRQAARTREGEAVTDEERPALRVYRNEAIDWFIAESAEHAVHLARAHYAGLGVDEDEMDLNFEQVPDNKVMTLRDGATVVGRRTAAEWARLERAGHFATTND